ncbi:MAG: TetR/AcrR family transcriptional regulator, partial [Mycobacterium sp.]|uniref:helix-turn-helix domain-containing protein n=1 Tax=Mycobacterium sp. TaxID=1785 RepID=UPI0028B45CBA
MQNRSLAGILDESTDIDRTILDTARAVFETYGVRRANIEDVAARAGVSRSTIYRRFPTK